ncbi:hypothetical protein, variant [Verruconis gallopava]|uniref:P-loop containing nucleoside triphosphate hydrolase protein n=1 Tax=Verruconis gallopava TaxID=253628 RepID=A0A0D1Z398_9PEZI|nr:uncharacterized protein PV09_02255 [Verruconis gallopava]XP_016217282.1 hypothetical protein, variant [Verruconis gallopava]KIW07412.1 hypothetical protein PV09_02255 [Verruconis gallopava]KIW07413.1 hypothetical protein, variant [Verruconis gallopava]
MDFYRISRMLKSSAAGGNVTELGLGPGVLDAIVPGYSVISRFLSQALGFDAGSIVSTGLLLFAIAKSWQYVSRTLWFLITEYASSLVYIEEHDELFKSVLDWIASQPVGLKATRLKAVTKQGSSPEEDKTDEHDLSDGKLFHFGKWAAKVPPKYEPYYGSYVFTYKYHLFIFERGRRERATATPWRQTSMDEQHIQIRTLGWSTAPLKDLLAHIKHWAREREHDITVIKRPQSKDTRRREGAWTRITSRPSRPMDTVVLDIEQKRKLIDDVNEYLSPTSPQWYASRGIPLRRGYLFHGPPGTGKSSLCFALAGLFGLDIYVISLLEPTLTESDLQQLFNNLPKRCIVLLEDIDSAGLTREDPSTDSKSDGEIGPRKNNARRGGMWRAGTEPDPTTNGISLSGLLNAIDGVASHEGRVLIMTSNFPEKLDPALIRPGRIDMQVKFTLATKLQIKEIFIRMYSSEPKRFGEEEGNGNQGMVESNTVSRKETFTREELLPLAEAFAGHVPEMTFSPAEVQNFLITRKKNPMKALEEVEVWKNELKATKDLKTGGTN